MLMGIYFIKNIINNKKYIGSSINIDKRFKRHINELNKNIHHNILLQRSWNKYGENSFKFGIVQLINNKEDLLKVEQKYLGSISNLFNLAPASGGDMLTNHPNKIEIIQKIKKSLILKNSKLTKQDKIDKWSKPGKLNGRYKDGLGGKKICIKCNKNLIQKNYKECMNCKDKTGKNNPFFNKKHTKEVKKIISEKNSQWFKNLSIEDKINKSIIRCVIIENIIYSGVSKAAKLLNVSNGTICHRIKSPNKLYDNYHYIDDKEYLLKNKENII